MQKPSNSSAFCMDIDIDSTWELDIKGIKSSGLKILNRPGIVGDLIFWENTTIKRQTYTPEIKERAVRMLIEAANDYPSTWSAIQAIAPKIGCTPETLRSWHKKHID